MNPTDTRRARLIKHTAVSHGGFQSFAELAAVTVATQYIKKGRRHDARRLLQSYLKRHRPTTRVAAAMRLAR